MSPSLDTDVQWPFWATLALLTILVTKLWTCHFSRGVLILFSTSYIICSNLTSARNTFSKYWRENQSKKFLILVWIFTHNPKYNNFTTISLVLGGGVVHVEDCSLKSPFFFPQHVTVEGECVTARLENALLTVLKFLLTQTAQPSVRTLSWKHQ